MNSTKPRLPSPEQPDHFDNRILFDSPLAKDPIRQMSDLVPGQTVYTDWGRGFIALEVGQEIVGLLAYYRGMVLQIQRSSHGFLLLKYNIDVLDAPKVVLSAPKPRKSLSRF